MLRKSGFPVEILGQMALVLIGPYGAGIFMTGKNSTTEPPMQHWDTYGMHVLDWRFLISRAVPCGPKGTLWCLELNLNQVASWGIETSLLSPMYPAKFYFHIINNNILGLEQWCSYTV